MKELVDSGRFSLKSLQQMTFQVRDDTRVEKSHMNRLYGKTGHKTLIVRYGMELSRALTD